MALPDQLHPSCVVSELEMARAGSLPIRVSPSKTPVRDDAFSSSDKPSAYSQSKWG